MPRTISGCQTPSGGRDPFSDNEAEGEQGQGVGRFEVKNNLGRCLLHIIQKYWSTKLPSRLEFSVSSLEAGSESQHFTSLLQKEHHHIALSPVPSRNIAKSITVCSHLSSLFRSHEINLHPSLHLEQANTHLPKQPCTCT